MQLVRNALRQCSIYSWAEQTSRENLGNSFITHPQNLSPAMYTYTGLHGLGLTLDSDLFCQDSGPADYCKCKTKLVLVAPGTVL